MKSIFIAGASGAIGRRMLPILKQRDYKVFGTTRSQEKANALSAEGIEPIVLDVFDAQAVRAAILRLRPNVIVHQLTDLPYGLTPALMPEAAVRNARIRKEGTKNLIDAAIAAGVQHFIAQSIAFVYAPGSEPHVESDPIDAPAGPRAVTLEGVHALESLTLNSTGIQGAVLRYGMLYGPRTGKDDRDGLSIPVHVDAAAHAAFLAIHHRATGIFNIVEDNAHVANTKARRELEWSPDFRI
ncbi:MAG TPA: NAD(P)-dependent oxidoreductase [Steroidobacteraceae bacterium]|jgi:nucleoside-diphosphate-sugar epimerase|nr:NAD(P)-dependent oxidoreductase [Steroidobacteraceae bacterium]